MPYDLLVDDLDIIFHPARPLGSFSARIEIANLFGVIEDETYKQLTLLREMRNACAHSKHSIGFDNALLKNVALKFFSHGATPDALIQKSMKLAFIHEAGSLAVVLSHGSRAEAAAVRTSTIEELLAERGASRGKPPAQ